MVMFAQWLCPPDGFGLSFSNVSGLLSLLVIALRSYAGLQATPIDFIRGSSIVYDISSLVVEGNRPES